MDYLFRREQNINLWGCINFGYMGLGAGRKHKKNLDSRFALEYTKL